LTKSGLKRKQGVEMPEEIAANTSRKYLEVYELLTGKKWPEA
jgi:phosphoribosylaminoimidazole-succinocarboxamide synthase